MGRAGRPRLNLRKATVALAGDVWFASAVAQDASVLGLSPADLLLLGFYPLLYAGLMLLRRSHGARAVGAVWLDGLIAAGATLAVLSALTLGPIADAAPQLSVAGAVVNLVYSILDDVLIVTLLLAIVGALAHAPRGMDRLATQRILAAAPALAYAAQLLRASRERWDGEGPDGLAGEAIPLAGRVLAACDAWATMTTAGPHRMARSSHDALATLRRGAGARWDPAVVEALAGVVQARAARASRERLAPPPAGAPLGTPAVVAEISAAQPCGQTTARPSISPRLSRS